MAKGSAGQSGGKGQDQWVVLCYGDAAGEPVAGPGTWAALAPVVDERNAAERKRRERPGRPHSYYFLRRVS